MNAPSRLLTGEAPLGDTLTGVLAGIARHAYPKAPMEVLTEATVTVEAGITGDFRGAVKPGGKGRRQVTLMERGDWDAAMRELGHSLPWQERRVNLLVDHLDLPQVPGALIRVGADVVLEVTVECDPCHRMDRIIPGLFAALMPDWRAGACTRVKQGGRIAVGDLIRIEIP
ncbi:MOSC domain-containing protein YiiM [Sphingomonas aerophila]|uniref:MOSC domain-containing protein YiiM n=2 Tax=Sphingomonas aerophila TaxID=1344948 RepID=A0A7W9EUT7_9SPHN|nr:MOSC domain-containing protein YiiM [Sphingomonas aerophila]